MAIASRMVPDFSGDIPRDRSAGGDRVLPETPAFFGGMLNLSRSVVDELIG